MSKKKIFIRVDSGLKIGTGHMMRCLSLAKILIDYDFQVCFLSKRLEGNICDLIIKNGYEIKYISNTNNKESTSNDVLDVIKIVCKEKEKPFIIVDHYDLDIEWEKQIKKYVEKLIVIDDLANRNHVCDLLLDQNLYENMEDRYSDLVPANCEILVGPEYALLRKEFLEIRKKAIPRKNLNRIMISFGGSDPNNETIKVLSALKKIQMKQIRIDVIIRKTNPNGNKIKEICDSIENCFLYQDVENMEEFMIDSDLSIGAAGITTWERCCLGLPSIVTTIADNQVEIVKAITKKKCIIHLGNSKETNSEDYEKCIQEINGEILRDISSNCFKIVDGKGSIRVSEKIYKLLKEKI